MGAALAAEGGGRGGQEGRTWSSMSMGTICDRTWTEEGRGERRKVAAVRADGGGLGVAQHAHGAVRNVGRNTRASRASYGDEGGQAIREGLESTVYLHL